MREVPKLRMVNADARFRNSRRFYFKQILTDFTLASPPIFVTGFAAMFLSGSDAVVRALSIVLFASGLAVFIKNVTVNIATRRLSMLMISLGFVLWYGLPGLLSTTVNDSRLIEQMPVFIGNDTLILVVLALSLFFFIWLIAYRVFSPPGISAQEVPTASLDSPKTLVLVSLAASALGLIPYATSGLSLTQIVAAVAESRSVDKPWTYVEHLGNETSPFLHLATGLRTAGASLLLVAMLDRRLGMPWRIVAGLTALVLVVLVFFDEGTRSVTAIMVLPAALLALVRMWNRSRLKAVLVLLAVVVALFLALQFQLLFRTEVNRAAVSDQLLESWTTLGGTTDYFAETALALRLVPAYHDYFRESALLEFVTSPIPRVLWPGKPVAQVAWFYTLMRWGSDVYTERGNVFPGIVGQYYMSWGWLGPIVLGLLFGLAAAITDRFLARTSPDHSPYSFAVGAMFAVWLLVTYRFLSPGFAYPVACAAGIVWISRLLARKRGSRAQYGIGTQQEGKVSS